MPGAAAAVRESRQKRSNGGKRKAAKRSSSSAATLRRGTEAAAPEVVATGYTPVDADLPPLDLGAQRIAVQREGRPNPKSRATSASRTASDRRVRYLSGEECDTKHGRRNIVSGSPSSSGVSSASSSPPRHSPSSQNMPVAAVSTHSSQGGASSSMRKSVLMDEDDVTCAICLDILHRPRSLPCGHTFCLICLQNYANSCRTIITCPSCRGAAHVPREGVMGLTPNVALAELAQAIREHRQDKGRHICLMCNSPKGVLECGHCKNMFCKNCGATHAQQVRAEVEELRQRLVTARETLSCRVEEDETRFRRLEESIEEVVENRVAKLHEDCRKLKAQVEEMRKDTQKQSDSISHHIDQVLDSSSGNQSRELEWEQLSQVHARLKKLLKVTSNAKGPRVTLDEVNLALSTSSQAPVEEPEVAEDEEEDKHVTVYQDHSLHYRSKGRYSKMRWGHHIGERLAGVAVNPVNSDIYVTGSDTCRIFIFDSNGKQIGSFGTRGHNDGQFLCPIGIAFSLVTSELLITDKWKHCIHVFDTEGNFIRQLGRKGKGYGHFTSPEGIATDRQGRIYVADTCNHRVQILDSDGVFLKEVGVVTSETLGDGQRYTKSEFNEPTGVAASSDGSQVYVVDAGNHRIKVFNGVTGERELMFGSRGRHKAQFESPESIAVDDEGFMLVGDSGNGRVQVFRPNGNFVRFLGSRGHNHGEFGWVSGTALSKSYDVVVTDFKNNLIAVF